MPLVVPCFTEHGGKPFTTFLRDNFALTGRLSEMITYAAALSVSHEGQSCPSFVNTLPVVSRAPQSDGVADSPFLCSSTLDTARMGWRRLRRYMKAAGRYGRSPFLIAQYGGVGEIIQGFCRYVKGRGGGTDQLSHPLVYQRASLTASRAFQPFRVCAVFGGLYMLGRPIKKITPPSSDKPLASIQMDEHETYTADCLIRASTEPASAAPYTEPSIGAAERVQEHRAVVITSKPIALPIDATVGEAVDGEEDEDKDLESRHAQAENVLFVFAPGALGEKNGIDVPVTALMAGGGTFSAPSGQCE